MTITELDKAVAAGLATRDVIKLANEDLITKTDLVLFLAAAVQALADFGVIKYEN